MKEIARELYRHRENFIIIGLTGRTGSGCSTTAKALTSPFNQLVFTEPLELEEIDLWDCQKHSIVSSFAKKRWSPFQLICVRDVISTFILECSYEEISEYLQEIHFKSIESIKTEFNNFKLKSVCMDNVYKRQYQEENVDTIYDFLNIDLPNFTSIFKKHFDHDGNKFIKLYQLIGDNIRKHGIAIPRKEFLPEHVFALSQRINQIIKILRRHNEIHGKKDYFVIDAFRNTFEVMFFKERYSAFYLFAVTCDEKDRKDRLTRANLPYDKILDIDSKEYNRNKPLKSINSFISQNISGCIEIADVFIRNNGEFQSQDRRQLHDQLIRYISLIQHPGLIPPSSDESNMQIALSQKLKSGCLSRQVGAIVTDKNGLIVATGYNDAPDKQPPCVIRSCSSLIQSRNLDLFSKFEKSTDFISEIKTYYDSVDEASRDGLSIPFCFKKIKNSMDNDDNQVHTRSLHAEERAFLSLIGSGRDSVGGTLYTTASPCVLCAKKAFHLGISRVVYIDPYPDISFEHIFGYKSQPIKQSLFSGAVGSAYHRLYSTIIALKDEIGAYQK